LFEGLVVCKEHFTFEAYWHLPEILSQPFSYLIGKEPIATYEASFGIVEYKVIPPI